MSVSLFPRQVANSKGEFPTLSRALLVLIFLLGAGFRFLNLGLVRFNYDNAYPLYDALRILDGKQLLWVGQPSSVFVNNPVLMSYIQALPLWLWRTPWAVSLLVTMLNTLAIGFIYRTGQRLFGTSIGLLAAFLFAISPWMVYFSLTTWLPALLPFFTTVIAWGLWPMLATRRRASQEVFIGFAALTVMTQTYLQALGILAQVGPLLLLFWRKIPPRAFYAGLVVFLMAFACFGFGLLSMKDVTLGKLEQFLAPKESAHFTAEGLNHAVRLVSGRDFEYVWGREETAAYQIRRTWSMRADYLLKGALAVGVGCALFELVRKGARRQAAVVLLWWFAVPVVLMSFSPYPIHIYYLLLSCPAGYLLTAWGLSLIFRQKYLRWIGGAVLVGLALLFGLNLHAAQQQVARAPTVPEFDGWYLPAAAKVGATIRELTEGSTSYPVRIYAEGHEAVVSAMSATYLTTLRGFEFPNYVLLPGQAPLLYVLVNTSPDATLLGPRYERFPDKDIVLADNTQIHFLRVLPYDEESARRLPATPVNWPSEAGLTLLGYTVPTTVQSGQSLIVITYWRVAAIPPESAEWFVGSFYHLTAPDGRQVINWGQYGQWGYVWQLGDIYAERVSIPIPKDLAPGDYTLALGLMDRIHGRTYTFIAPDGWFQTATVSLSITP